jgi:hypothetical protein
MKSPLLKNKQASKEDIIYYVATTAKDAFNALLNSLSKGDIESLKKICTIDGYQSLQSVINEGNISEQFKKLGNHWRESEIHWREHTDNLKEASASLYNGTKSTPGIYFILTETGWKFDKVEKGK